MRARAEVREVREETEPLAVPSGWGAGAPEDDDALPGDDQPAELPPLTASPMGTHDRPPTRVESPVARRPPSGARGPRTPAVAASPERPEDRIGATLGAYRLHALIGKGGMGFVYRAEHARLGREVALKLLRSDYSRRRDSVARFFQEARTVNRIRHRNIVDVTDFVELEDGTTFIIMELLRGQSLGAWARHSFELPRALAILIQICDGLAAAHAVGVIHRDLKPDNVVVMPTGDGAELVKLLDFGVAKLLNRDDEDIGLETAAGSVIGTPAYMSPEQAGGLPIDARADIYSLGAIMYELFCGQPLFRGTSFGEYVRKHLNELPVPPRDTPRGPTIDPRLEQIILHSLEKDPARRYQTIEELRQELLELLAGYEAIDGPSAVRLHRSARMDAAAVAGLRTPPPHLPGPLTPPPRLSGQLTPPPRLSAQLTPPPLPPQHPMSASMDPMLADSLVRLDPGLVPRAGRRLWIAAAATVAAGIVVAGVLVAAARHRSSADGESGRAVPPAAPVPPPPPQVTSPVPAPSVPAPVVAPAVPSVASLIEVRIDAPDGARVLRAGADVEVCVAPCLLAIDPADGDSTTHRDYVVRLAGHADRTIAIDLAAPPPAIAVRFDDATTTTTAPTGDGAARRRPVRVDDVPAGAGPSVDRPSTATTPSTTTTPATTTTPPTTPPPKKKPTIDPTDTIDPFAGEK